MAVDAYCSWPQYAAHIAPVMKALPPDRRGCCYLGLNYNELADIIVSLGMTPSPGRPPPGTDGVMIASGPDLPNANSRQVIFVEHGAGQTYATDAANHQGYTGGRGRDGVSLFLCPNERTAAANLVRYPGAHAAVIGDPTISEFDAVAAALGDPPDRQPVVAVTWHFDLPGLGIPETRTTWPYWANAALDLAEAYEVLGHAHPKAQREILPWWERYGVMTTDSFAVVAAVAELLVLDNSSVGPEFARTGKPILWLNAPFYRRDVHHGGRFWEWTEWAECCDDADDLTDAVGRALADPPERQAARAKATRDIYPYIGLEAARRGAAAILEWT